MIPAEFFRELARRWYVAVVMIAALAAACVSLWPGQHVYSARSAVTFLWPGSVSLSKVDDGGLAALVNFAAMVRLAIDDGQAQESASFGGSLVGAGVRNGFTVVLPNSGGQWSSEYDQPRLTVEAVAATPQAATAKAEALVDQITTAAADLQRRLAIPTQSFISTSAAAVDVADGGASVGTRIRGEAAALVIGVLLTCTAVVSVDRVAGLRRRGEKAR
ncbi:hypothetical protein [Sinomonas susongensis]|uniref:hypothetical protein n=1 Tax=Sinomonas susongensis TaxID=1324851 RepID=UPI001108ECAF|nr:hypothetical protein [Sinomonas susongensis]